MKMLNKKIKSNKLRQIGSLFIWMLCTSCTVASENTQKSDDSSVATEAALTTEAAGSPIFNGKDLAGWHLLDVPKTSNYHTVKENYFVKSVKSLVRSFLRKSKKTFSLFFFKIVVTHSTLVGRSNFQPFSRSVEFPEVCDSDIHLKSD